MFKLVVVSSVNCNLVGGCDSFAKIDALVAHHESSRNKGGFENRGANKIYGITLVERWTLLTVTWDGMMRCAGCLVGAI